jgi:patched 1
MMMIIDYFIDSVLSAKLQWTSLNPQQVLNTFKTQNYPFPFDTLEKYMKRAGISTGYTEKPCLNPKDPLCPETAQNKKSQMVKIEYMYLYRLF